MTHAPDPAIFEEYQARKLRNQPDTKPVVILTSGNRAAAIRQVVEIAKPTNSLFSWAGELVAVDGGAVRVCNETDVLLWLADNAQLKKRVKIGEEFTEVKTNPPKVFLTDLLSELPKHMPTLTAIITTQTIRVDGALINRHGFDSQTGIYLHCPADNMPPVPDAPTAEQAMAAAAELMAPFAQFGYVSNLDYSVKLAALLSVVVRATVGTRPVIAYDAPAMGSGKTLLARCDSALATGGEASVWPYTSGGEEETRKRLAAGLLNGAPVIVWDNIMGAFNSASFAAALTSTHYEDRFLGKSKSFRVANKTQFILTGNNIDLYGDLPRRVLRCRIDPNTDRPFSRQFKQNPCDTTLANRHAMTAKALTIIRAWQTAKDAGEKPAPGRLASFEDWDSLVRQPIAWLARLRPDKYADPMERITEEVANETGAYLLDALMDALRGVFGRDAFYAADVLREAQKVDDKGAALRAAINDIYGGKPGADLSARAVGKILANRRDSVVNGRKLDRHQSGTNTAIYRVIDV